MHGGLLTARTPRTAGPVIRGAADLSVATLSRALGTPVQGFEMLTEASNWSHQIRLQVDLADGSRRALRLKCCLGDTFGPSEVRYYTQDYLDLADAPLVPCHDAAYEKNVGYHLLLEDLAGTHHDRRDAPPGLAYGLALAQALARLHRHHWGSQPAPGTATLDRYVAEIRPGVKVLEAMTGLAMQPRFDAHETALRARWSSPRGMSLLHGDLNPTNVLTPVSAEVPVYFLDRQPFDWSLQYGVAVYDLAYATAPWWPEDDWREHQGAVLRHWHQSLGQVDYSWEDALADWRLSVEQCLHVPMEWCAKPESATRMRWLWEAQLARVRAALTTLSTAGNA